MKDFSFILIFITVSTRKEAQKISDKLLEEKLVACTNIIKNANSLFWRKNKIESTNEFLLIAKTEFIFFNDIVNTLKPLHCYDVPKIITIPTINTNKNYLDRIKKSIKKFKYFLNYH